MCSLAPRVLARADDEEQVPDKETDIGRIGIIRDVYTVILPYEPTR